ncbi:MAG: hypothetical protein A2351_08980 [Omnitrophica bacterium RIFOXYB12_FULL_50_7]|nr:MAG: hypothetical protein A2351_08980 [Omnitrophica bacterium RIFOXYB12_FULL_50_7]
MDDPRKLVRGLKDISSLFNTVSEEVPVRRSPEVQVLGVSSPDCDGDSLLLNTFFASQIASSGKACSLLSVLSRYAKVSSGPGKGMPESFGNHLERYCLYWDELRDLISEPFPPRAEGILQSRDIFLDFEYRHLLHFEKAVSLLDKWVLLLKPTAESLTEGYKMMKVGLALNPQLEFYITLSGKAEEAQGAMAFDQFSDFVSRHLDAHLGWLGWMDLADPARHFSAALYTEPLKYQHWNAKPSLQKFMLAGWIDSLERKAKASALVEVS